MICFWTSKKNQGTSQQFKPNRSRLAGESWQEKSSCVDHTVEFCQKKSVVVMSMVVAMIVWRFPICLVIMTVSMMRMIMIVLMRLTMFMTCSNIQSGTLRIEVFLREIGSTTLLPMVNELNSGMLDVLASAVLSRFIENSSCICSGWKIQMDSQERNAWCQSPYMQIVNLLYSFNLQQAYISKHAFNVQQAFTISTIQDPNHSRSKAYVSKHSLNVPQSSTISTFQDPNLSQSARWQSHGSIFHQSIFPPFEQIWLTLIRPSSQILFHAFWCKIILSCWQLL